MGNLKNNVYSFYSFRGVDERLRRAQHLGFAYRSDPLRPENKIGTDKKKIYTPIAVDFFVNLQRI